MEPLDLKIEDEVKVGKLRKLVELIDIHGFTEKILYAFSVKELALLLDNNIIKTDIEIMSITHLKSNITLNCSNNYNLVVKMFNAFCDFSNIVHNGPIKSIDECKNKLYSVDSPRDLLTTLSIHEIILSFNSGLLEYNPINSIIVNTNNNVTFSVSENSILFSIVKQLKTKSQSFNKVKTGLISFGVLDSLTNEEVLLLLGNKDIEIELDASKVTAKAQTLQIENVELKYRLFQLNLIHNNIELASPGKRRISEVRDDLKKVESLTDLFTLLNINEIREMFSKGDLYRENFSNSCTNKHNNTSYYMPKNSIINDIILGELNKLNKIDKKGLLMITQYVKETNVVYDSYGGTGEVSRVIWKNPKPGTKNKKTVKVGDFVNVDGLHVLQKVERVTLNEVFLEGLSKRYTVGEVYPMYLQSSKEFKVGNVITHNDEAYVIKSIDSNSNIETTDGKKLTNNAFTNVYSKFEDKIQYTQYTCGAVEIEGVKYSSKSELSKNYPGSSLKENKVEFTFDQENISKHYGIAANVLKPKENLMMSLLKRTLDHPLNVAVREWALIVGPSGSGKTELVVDYANKAGKRYIKLQGNAQVTVDDLIGYKSITDGTYFPSLLREAVEEGLVFILDEIDSCNSNTLLTLNGLKQEYFQFPDKLVKVHPEFKFVATANTLEYSEKYNSRSPMDKATLARFDVIKYEMEEHDLAMRYGLEYIKVIPNISRLEPREVSRLVTKMKIQEESEAC